MSDWPRTIDGRRAELESRGYVEVGAYGDLRPGVRISHVGHRWPHAYMRGTATVVAVYLKPDSPWERKYDRPDVEVVYQSDREPEGVCPITWADYHCCVTDLSSADSVGWMSVEDVIAYHRERAAVS